jgi:prepilin signal peptidase PulO-like enzyme (type II secretory pathway)
MAIVGGAGVVLAVTATLFHWIAGAIGGAVVGVGLLVPALRMHMAMLPPEPELQTPHDPDADASLLRTELPFGPFLAMSALVFLFAERWIFVNFRLPGG